MSAKEQIGRLSHLLHRVQTRAQEPRPSGLAYAPNPVLLPHAPALSAPPPALSAHPPALSAPPPRIATPTPEPVEVEHDSLPPLTMQVANAEADGAQAYLPSDDDADVEVSSETVEVDIDIDEPMPMESGAQPVAQQTMPPEDLEEEFEEVDEPVLATQPSVRPQEPAHEEEEQEEITLAPPLANEVEEPAPSSSRRPIAGEEVAEAYGAESAPRHTPPPESGKQVAAPSVHPVAVRSAADSIKPSAPPPSMEGHTLVGGWREPGLGVPQIGVPQISPAASTGRVPAVEPPVAAQPSGTRLTPDVTRPELAASGNVATFEGPAPVAKPTTLGELLDMTLSL